MNWYLVKMIFSVETKVSQPAKAKFEEQLRLIRELSLDLAILKARKLGKGLETGLRLFIDVREIIPIETFSDGIALDSIFFEADDREKFIHSVLLKSLSLQKSEAILH